MNTTVRLSLAMLTLGTMATAAATLAGCASQNEKITRVGPKDNVDVNSRFNAEDARILAETLINDALSKPWIDRFTAANGNQLPKMVLGNVKNKTSDFSIDSNMVTGQVQQELLNSGKVRVFAAKDIRNDLRAERFDTEFADPATVKKAASEIKADFMLLGELRENVQVSGDGRSKFVVYQLYLEMTDMATTEKVWIKTADSRKFSAR